MLFESRVDGSGFAPFLQYVSEPPAKAVRICRVSYSPNYTHTHT